MRQPKVFNATKLDPAVERSQTRWFQKENLPDQLGDGLRLPPSSGKRTGTETGFVPTSSVKRTKKRQRCASTTQPGKYAQPKRRGDRKTSFSDFK